MSRISRVIKKIGIKVLDKSEKKINKISNIMRFNNVVDSSDSFEKELSYLKSIIEKYEIISFDLFDTLFLRNILKPSNVFDIIGENRNIFKFSKFRIDAEKTVRQKYNREVSIDEIYCEIKKNCEQSDVLKNDELYFEDQFIRKNDFMYQVYLHAQNKNKTIVYTSDMYLPDSFIIKKLEDCGYNSNYRLFLSSKYGYQKNNGSLFSYLKEEYPGKSILHIGDNYLVDYKIARKNKVDSYYYKNIHERSNNITKIEYSPITGSVYKALSDRMQYCMQENHLYKVGYSFFGFVVLGYVQFIKKIYTIQKCPILFASRDMYIVYKLYKIIYPNDLAFYVRCSRFSLIRADYKNQDRRFLDWLKENEGVRVFDALKGVHLDKLITIIDEICPGASNLEINKNNIDRIKDIFVESKSEIKKLFYLENHNAVKYFSNIVKNNDKAIFVDLSGNCTSGIAVENLLREKNEKFRIINCQLYSDQKSSFIASKIGNHLYPYLFSYNRGQEFFELIYGINNGELINYLESIFSENCGSLISYESLENFKISKENSKSCDLDIIHKGIIDFCNDYIEAIGLDYGIIESDVIDALFSGLRYFDLMDKQNLVISNVNKM